MSGNLSGFNANNVQPQTAFEVLPVGKYPAIITDTEMKTTKSGEGEYLQLTFEVIGEACKGRRVWARLNLKNKNETAVKIAQAELSAICRAVNVMTPQDSSQFHNIPLVIDVGAEKNKETGEMGNRIKGYHPAAGAAHSAPVVAQAVASGAASPAPEKPPWERNK